MTQRRNAKTGAGGRWKGLAIAVAAALVWAWGWLPVGAAPQVTVVGHYFLLTPAPQGLLNVQERIVLNNPGPSLPAGQVRFYLPDGVQKLTLHEGGGIPLAAGDGVVEVKGQIPPGQSLFDFGYMVSLQGAPHFILRHKSDFFTGQVYILTPPQGVWVRGERVADQGVNQSGDTEFRLFTMEKLPPGTDVPLVVSVGAGKGGTVTRKPPVAFHSPGHIRFWYQSPFRGINAHLFLAIIILAPLTVLAVAVVRRRKNKAGAAAQQDEDDEDLFQRLLVRERVLMDKLKELERQHAQGEVDEETYQKLREAYKRKLVQVKVQLRSFTG